jgi:uncharacterized protein (TIGR00369 family)
VPAHLADAKGRLPLGSIGVLADTAIGHAVVSTLPPERASTTVQLRIELVAPLTSPPGQLSTRSRILHRDGDDVLAAAEIFDAHGREVAQVSGRCLSTAIRYADAIDAAPEASAAAYGSPPDGAPASAGAGLSALRQLATSEGLPSPLAALLGLRLTRAADGDVELCLPADDALANLFGAVHGGLLAAALDQALMTCFASASRPGTLITPYDLAVHYLRPVRVDGSLVRCRARLDRRGRRPVARAELRDSEGALCTFATMSARLHSNPEREGR